MVRRTRWYDWLGSGLLLLLSFFLSRMAYEQTMEHGHRGSNDAWMLAAMLSVGSLWSLWTCWKNRDMRSLSPRERQIALLAPQRASRAAIIGSCVFYAAFLNATLKPECQEVFRKAVGEQPMGMPVWLFTWLVFSILFIPAPFGLHHFLRCLSAEQVIGNYAAYQAILKDDPDLRRSRRTAGIVLGFYVLLLLGWITFATWKGI